jgi:hypothetical protein
MHDVENLSIPLAGGARGETSGLDPHSPSPCGPSETDRVDRPVDDRSDMATAEDPAVVVASGLVNWRAIGNATGRIQLPPAGPLPHH